MQNGVNRGTGAAPSHTRAVPYDAWGAILLAETAMVQVLDVGETPATQRKAGRRSLEEELTNAFGEGVERTSGGDPVARVLRTAERVAAGERVALLASTRTLLPAREAMQELASRRLACVFHAVETDGAEAALALSEIGWGLLFASDVEESLDLTLVARRAAEDSGTPFLVVHDLARVRRVEPLVTLDPALVDAFIGPAEARLRRAIDPAHPGHAQVGVRAFAERVPFALASALRELESLTHRKRDLLTRSAVGAGADAPLQLVGLGALGDVLLGEIPRLRAAGHDVGAVKVTAFRPFPGPRAVKLLARALAVTVVEHRDTPLAQSNPLTRELKSAFADAITWAPDYPGVGRVPRVHSGVVHHAAHDVEAHDVLAIVRNMEAGEQGKRFFMLGGDAAHDLDVTGARTSPAAVAGTTFHVRGILADGAVAATAGELTAATLASVLSLKVRAAIRPLAANEGGFAFDLVAGAERPSGAHLASTLGLLVVDDVGALLRGNPLARLGNEATLAVPSRKATPDVVWADLPPYAKAIVFDRHARLVGWELAASPSDDEESRRWLTAAAIAGVTLATLAAPADGLAHVDASLVEREVRDAVASLDGAQPELAERAGQTARRAFEGSVVVPRGLVEKDEDAIQLGRKDARAAVA